MKKIYGDYPNIPDELRKKDVDLYEKLQADTPKRTGNIKKVRHKIKEILKNLIK